MQPNKEIQLIEPGKVNVKLKTSHNIHHSISWGMVKKVKHFQPGKQILHVMPRTKESHFRKSRGISEQKGIYLAMYAKNIYLPHNIFFM